MTLSKKRMILRRIIDLDAIERLEIQPKAGDYHLRTKRWREDR